MADEKTPQTTPSAAAKATPAAAKQKKEKPPAVEDKPFGEFIQQHFLPSLDTALKEQGFKEVTLSFEQSSMQVLGMQDSEQYWQVKGQWPNNGRQFTIAFTKEDIKGPKLFYLADQGTSPSTIEQFMGDERRITLDLMVLYTLQRLNSQKWLTRN
jgi:hypothetical protein